MIETGRSVRGQTRSVARARRPQEDGDAFHRSLVIAFLLHLSVLGALLAQSEGPAAPRTKLSGPKFTVVTLTADSGTGASSPSEMGLTESLDRTRGRLASGGDPGDVTSQHSSAPSLGELMGAPDQSPTSLDQVGDTDPNAKVSGGMRSRMSGGADVQSQSQRCWRRSKRPGHVRVGVTLDTNGRLVSRPWVIGRQSNMSEAQKAAIKAVTDCAPYRLSPQPSRQTYELSF